MKNIRQPSKKAKLAATKGSVIIATQTGSVVLTPALAKTIAEQLPELASMAEKIITEPISTNSAIEALSWKSNLIQ